MTRTVISACRDARAPHWQLGPLPPPQGRLTLIGWNQRAGTTDGGIPEAVARVLTDAFTSIARVTFPSSEVSPPPTNVWSPLDNDLVRVIAVSRFGERIAAKLQGAPSGITLLSTRRSETAFRLFDDAGFPWWLQGQLILLSTPAAPPPDVDEETLAALFGDGWATRADSLAADNVEGIVRPGVDGDVAGVLAFSASFEQVLLAELEQKALAAGFEWASPSESAFPAP